MLHLPASTAYPAGVEEPSQLQYRSSPVLLAGIALQLQCALDAPAGMLVVTRAALPDLLGSPPGHHITSLVSMHRADIDSVTLSP